MMECTLNLLFPILDQLANQNDEEKQVKLQPSSCHYSLNVIAVSKLVDTRKGFLSGIYCYIPSQFNSIWTKCENCQTICY